MDECVWVCVIGGQKAGEGIQIRKKQDKHLGYFQLTKYIFNTDNNCRSQTCLGY